MQSLSAPRTPLHWVRAGGGPGGRACVDCPSGAWRESRMCRAQTGKWSKGVTGRLRALQRLRSRGGPEARAQSARRGGAPPRGRPRAPPVARPGTEGAEGRGGGGGVEGGRGEGSRSEGGLIDPAILVKIFKMADGGAASQDESSAAAAAAAGNHYGILHIHIHTRAGLSRPPRDLA